MSFRVGSRVIIVDTANVLARCPELVGSVGADPRLWTHRARNAPGPLGNAKALLQINCSNP